MDSAIKNNIELERFKEAFPELFEKGLGADPKKNRFIKLPKLIIPKRRKNEQEKGKPAFRKLHKRRRAVSRFS